MAEMYVWEVRLEVEWSYTIKQNKGGKSRTFNEVDSDVEYVVAAPTGLKAIEVAKKIATDKERGYTDDWSSETEVTIAKPVKVIDVIGLELKDTLDG